MKKVAAQRRTRRRLWKLRSLIKEEEDGTYVSMHKGGTGGDALHDDYEDFLADIEADPHARSHVNLYKDPCMWRIGDDGNVVPGAAAAAAEEGGEEEGPVDEEEGISAGLLLDGLVLGEEEELEEVGRGIDSDDNQDAQQRASQQQQRMLTDADGC